MTSYVWRIRYGSSDVCASDLWPAGHSGAQSSRKRAIRCGSGCLSIAFHLLSVCIELFLEASGDKCRISLAKLGKRDAGALGIAHLHHAFGKEQQADASARRLLVRLVIAQKPTGYFLGLAIVQEGTQHAI